MEKSKDLTISAEETEIIVNAKPSEVLSQLQSASTEYFLVETTGTFFSIVFLKASNTGPGTRLDGMVEEFDQRSRIKIRTSDAQWPKNMILTIFFYCLFFIVLCLFFFDLYCKTHSNWIFMCIVLGGMLIWPIIQVKFHRIIVNDQKTQLLRFLKDKFPDIAAGN